MKAFIRYRWLKKNKTKCIRYSEERDFIGQAQIIPQCQSQTAKYDPQCQRQTAIYDKSRRSEMLKIVGKILWFP